MDNKSTKVGQRRISRAALVITRRFILREVMLNKTLLGIVDSILEKSQTRREGFVIFECLIWYNIPEEQYVEISKFIESNGELNRSISL